MPNSKLDARSVIIATDNKVQNFLPRTIEESKKKEDEKKHNFDTKPKKQPTCEVNLCENKIYCYNICKDHYIINNESKRCSTSDCINKKSNIEDYCEKCSEEIKSLRLQLLSADKKLFKIVRIMNDKYNMDYSDEIYLH